MDWRTPPSEVWEEFLALTDHNLRALSVTQRKQLRIIKAIYMALDSGQSTRSLALQLRVSPANICRVKGNLRKGGITAYLSKWKSQLKCKNPENSSRPRGRRGRISLEELVRHKKFEGDLIDIVCAYVAPREILLIIAVRNRPAKKASPCDRIRAGADSVRRRVSATSLFQEHFFKTALTLTWNPSDPFDSQALSVCEQISRIVACRQMSNQEDAQWAFTNMPLNTNDKQYRYFALSHGVRSAEILDLSGRAWPGRRIRKFETVEELLATLSTIAKQLREVWDGTGLLPSLCILQAALSSWRPNRATYGFCWHTTALEALELAAVRQMQRSYHAVMGGVFDIDADIRSNIWYETFALRGLENRPRISVNRETANDDQITATVSVLPGIDFASTDQFAGDELRKIEAEYRKNLRNNAPNRTLRLTYSNRFEGNRGHLLADAMQYGEYYAKVDTSAHCVLIYRHWLSPHPPSTPELLARVRDTIGRGAHRQELLLQRTPQPCLVFHAPNILKRIEEAYCDNWYGDHLLKMHRDQKALAERLTAQRDAFPRVGTDGLIRVNPSAHQWCRHSPTNRGRRRWEEAIQTKAFKNSSRSRIRATDGFRTTFCELDADLLLLGIFYARRPLIDDSTNEWAELVRATIEKRYDCATPKGRSNIVAALPENLREPPAERFPELEDTFRRTLNAFCENSRRVSRFAIENAQRLWLAGEKPCVCFVESERALFRRWRAFLKLHLAGRLMDKPKRQRPKPVAQQTKVNVAIETVTTLMASPGDPKAVKIFRGLAKSLSPTGWLRVREEVLTWDFGGIDASSSPDRFWAEMSIIYTLEAIRNPKLQFSTDPFVHRALAALGVVKLPKREGLMV